MRAGGCADVRILVTGVDGLVGAGVVRYLAQTNKYEVFTTSRKKRANQKHIYCDLCSMDLFSVLSGLNVDAIVHCAAAIPANFSDSAEVFAINKKIDENVLHAVRQMRSRLIYMSGVTVCGLSGRDLVTETSPADLFSEYIAEKYEAELAIQTEQKDHVVFRLSSPYGPDQKRGSVVKLFVDRAKNGEDIIYYGQGSRTQNFIHTVDIGRAVEQALSYRDGGVFNIAGNKSISMKELAEIVAEIANEAFESQIKARASGFEDPQENLRRNISIEKAERLLNWKPEVHLRDGLTEMITGQVVELQYE